MAEVPAFKLSRNPIMQGLLILSIFLSGYFLYLLSSSIIGPGSKIEIIEFFLIIVSFGLLVVFINGFGTGLLSLIFGGGFVGNNKFLGYVLHVIIFLSSFFIILFKLNETEFLNFFCVFYFWKCDFIFYSISYIIYIAVFSIGYYIISKLIHFLEKDQSVLVIKKPGLKTGIEVRDKKELEKILGDRDIKHKFEDDNEIIYFSRNYNLIEKKYHYREKKNNISNTLKLTNLFYENLIRIIVIFYLLLFTFLILPLFNNLNLSFWMAFIISILSFSIHRVIDYYSTWKVIKEFDNDFRKYKLNKYYRELSPTLPNHPNPRDIISPKILIINIIVFIILFVVPLILYNSYIISTTLCFSFLLTIPFIYLNNTIFANNIRISKIIAKGKK